MEILILAAGAASDELSGGTILFIILSVIAFVAISGKKGRSSSSGSGSYPRRPTHEEQQDMAREAYARHQIDLRDAARRDAGY